MVPSCRLSGLAESSAPADTHELAGVGAIMLDGGSCDEGVFGDLKQRWPWRYTPA